MRPVTATLCLLVIATAADAQQVDVQEIVLDNGMTFLLLPRSEEPNMVSAGWVAKVGSVNERPGITGLSHFFEHMMFKGTDVIGTSDAQQDEVHRLHQADLRNQINDLVWRSQYDRAQHGEIDDPWNKANDTPQIEALRAALAADIEAQRDVTVPNEFDSIYSNWGATGMNAGTSHDFTIYFINIPANKLEGWAWMESHRLEDSVFREFDAERDVVHEERRMRTESTPTGEFDEQLEAMFWTSSPYSWPVIGWPSDLESYTMDEAQRYYDIYYRPNNLVGMLVGDFDPDTVAPLIEKYFGRLTAADALPPPVVTREIPQMAPKRMTAEIDGQSQIRILYHTVPFGHVDGAALELLAGVLNGRTGRLHKSMVEGSEIAASTRAQQEGRKYGGRFSFQASVKLDATPDELEAAWEDVLLDLQEEPVSPRELQKVKNQALASTYQALSSNFFLMLQLGIYETMGNWEYINTHSQALQSVTAEDVQRVAETYLVPTQSLTAQYHRSATAAPVDDELAALPPEAQVMVNQALSQLEAAPAEMLPMVLLQMQQQAGQVPPEMKPALEYLMKKVQERIDAANEQEGDQ